MLSSIILRLHAIYQVILFQKYYNSSQSSKSLSTNTARPYLVPVSRHSSFLPQPNQYRITALASSLPPLEKPNISISLRDEKPKKKKKHNRFRVHTAREVSPRRGYMGNASKEELSVLKKVSLTLKRESRITHAGALSVIFHWCFDGVRMRRSRLFVHHLRTRCYCITARHYRREPVTLPLQRLARDPQQQQQQHTSLIPSVSPLFAQPVKMVWITADDKVHGEKCRQEIER